MNVRFCENNEGSGLVYKRLKAEFPVLDISRNNCLKSCSTCNNSLFAIVEGIALRGKNTEDLFLKIAALLRKERGDD